MGPYRFLNYTSRRQQVALLRNPMTGDSFTASVTHVIPFDYDIEPVLIGRVQQAMEEFRDAVE
jgi:hypothetical protein